MSKQTLSAQEIASLLGLNPPTAEQQAVIEAPLDGVYRVIAGAGSGKTETMALRVLFLVANGYVEPRNVLGLTFTKKASGELAKRLVERLDLLGEKVPGIRPPDPFDRPRVHTYNAFATRLFTDYSVYLGIDGDVHVSSAATAWGVARQVVKDSRDTRLADLGVGVDRIASLVLKLSQTLGENEVEKGDLVTLVESFRELADLPNGGRGAYAEVDGYVDTVSALLPLWDLVEQFGAAKRRRGIVEFSDQVRFALEVVRKAPQVVDTLRDTHSVVLLDEYQDTSVLQARLLSTIFADHPVMAVGDPHQAIYGWRGASAGNLTDFPDQFARTSQATTFTLSISWRNSLAVLGAANAVAEPLTQKNPDSVVTLTAPEKCLDGSVFVQITETVDEEADAVANWFSSRLKPSGDKEPTAALLLRNRTHQDVFVRALKARGIPVHVLGIGGLLSDPVVADLVCGVAVVHRPEANTELVRLLAGGRFRVGVADLYALAQVAKKLSRSQVKKRDGDDETSDKGEVSPPPLSLGEALESLRTTSDTSDIWQQFSPAGREQLAAAAALIHSRRRYIHDDLFDQLVGCEKALRLDIEHLANPLREDSDKARTALFDAAATYQASHDEASVSGFIDWLQEAEWRDNLQPRSDKPEAGCVQVLTIHGAKGLEWDYVAIPRLVDDELPSKSRDGTRGWIQRGELPYPLRGDREHLPHFSFAGSESRKDVKERAEGFFADVLTHQLTEERRLAYVAITRTIVEVGLFGSWWATQKNPRQPSVFLRELADAGLIGPLPGSSEYEDNPAGDDHDDVLWPGDPLGARREVVEAAASEVLSRGADLPKGVDDETRAVLDEVVARSTRRQSPTPAIPFRLSASTLHAILKDVDQVMARRQRPLPRKTGGAERSGTQFHEWVEHHYRDAGRLALGGDWDIDQPDDDDVTDQQAWREAFLASDFVTRTPLAIEREIYLPLGGRVVVCKIDAVFPTDNGVDIIDWKTGRPPTSADEEQARAIQLSLYRLAWSAWSGTPLDQITAGWWFSRTGEVVRPTQLFDEDTLTAMVDDAISGYGG